MLSNQLCGPFQPSLRNEKAELQGLVDHWTSWWAASVTLTKWLCCRWLNRVWPSGWPSLMCNPAKSLWNPLEHWNWSLIVQLSLHSTCTSNSTITIYWTISICHVSDTVISLPYHCKLHDVFCVNAVTVSNEEVLVVHCPHATHPLKSLTNLSPMCITPIAGLLLIQSDSMQIRSQLTISIFGAEDKFLLEAKQLRDTCWKAIPSS